MNLLTVKLQQEQLLGLDRDKPILTDERDCSLTFRFKRKPTFNLPNSITQYRHYQQYVAEKFLRGNQQFAYLAWPRRAGKEVLTWSLLLNYANRHRCTCAMIYPDLQVGKKIIFTSNLNTNGTTQDFLDFLDPGVDRINDVNITDRRITLGNGSTIWILGSENYNKLRGMNLNFVVFSEFAFCDPESYKVIRPMLVENNGRLILQTTFDGRNHAYKFWEDIQRNDQWLKSYYTCETLCDLKGNRYITDEQIQTMRDEGLMSEFEIRREFYMDVTGDDQKYYFVSVMDSLKKMGRLKKNLAIPGIPAHKFWDIGVNDSNFIIIVQIIDGIPKIIGSIESQGKTFVGDIMEVDKWCQMRQIPHACHYLPHDGKNRGKHDTKEYARSGIEIIEEDIGQRCVAVNAPKSDATGLNSTRSLLSRCEIDEVEAARLLLCLENHAKERDEKRGVFKRSRAQHWTSNGVKAVQTMAIAFENGAVQYNRVAKSGSYA